MRPILVTRPPRPAPTGLHVLTLLVAVALVGAVAEARPGLLESMAPSLHFSERIHLSHHLVAALDDLGDDRVVTAGLGVKTADVSSFVLRSYEASTGALISENEFDLSVDQETAEAVANGGGRVYAIGSGLTSAGTLSLLVRAYDALTGELLWIDELNPAANPRHQTRSASPRSHSHSQFTVRATDKESGQVLWQDEFLPSDEDLRAGTDSGSINHGKPGPHDFSLVVRTYEDPTNKLLWEDQFDSQTKKERTGENGAELEPSFTPAPKESLQVVLGAAR